MPAQASQERLVLRVDLFHLYERNSRLFSSAEWKTKAPGASKHWGLGHGFAMQARIIIDFLGSSLPQR